MNSVRLEFGTRCGESIFHIAMVAGLVYATVYWLLPRQKWKLYLICYAIFCSTSGNVVKIDYAFTTCTLKIRWHQ